MTADNPNIKIPNPPEMKFILHIQTSTPEHPAWQWHIHSQHPTFNAARQAFDKLYTEAYHSAKVENTVTKEIDYITRNLNTKTKETRDTKIKDLTESWNQKDNPLEGVAKDLLDLKCMKTQKKRYASDDKIILNLQGLRFASKEDMIYSVRDKMKYRIKWDYKGSSGYVTYENKDERDQMFNKIREAL